MLQLIQQVPAQHARLVPRTQPLWQLVQQRRPIATFAKLDMGVQAVQPPAEAQAHVLLLVAQHLATRAEPLVQRARHALRPTQDTRSLCKYPQ